MRIIAFSDSHGKYDRIEKLIQRTKDSCGLYLFAGDNLRDADGLEISYPGIKLIKVPGNCDFSATEPPIAVVEECGKKIILTHGHLHRAKYGLDDLKRLAKQNEADIVVYGHTHVRAVDYCDGVYYINPGSLALPKDGLPPSYAIIDILPAGILATAADY